MSPVTSNLHATAGPFQGCLVLAVTAASVLAGSSAHASGASRAALDEMIAQHAKTHGLPLALVHRVVKRESNYNPRAVSRGNYGLMQIRHGTARGLGYKGGTDGLLDASTNLRYAVAYLAGAYKLADGNHDRTVALYSRGYYYDAKRRGLVGRLPTVSEQPVEMVVPPVAPTPEQPSWFATLFGVGDAPGPEAAEPQASPTLAEAEPRASEEPPEPKATLAKPRRKTAQSAHQRKPAEAKPRMADQVAVPGRS